MEASARLEPRQRALLGQYLTPEPIAVLMAGLLQGQGPVVRILDPGAGTGCLSAAAVFAICGRARRPAAIEVTAYEVDPLLVTYLRQTLEVCRAACDQARVRFRGRIVMADFLEAGATALAGDLLGSGEVERFDCAILNPPYRKISANSTERELLRSIGLETTNLYAGFLAVASRLLEPGGEMVAITPRSFCNGPYFEPFRHFFFREMRFHRLHVFDLRDNAFAEARVLQENIVFRAERAGDRNPDVVVSASADAAQVGRRMRRIKHTELIRDGDRHAFVHIAPDDDVGAIRERIAGLKADLAELGLAVSTGRVVDFRAREMLRAEPGRDTIPLIYPCHLRAGYVEWPRFGARKPNALAMRPEARDLLVPEGYYVLTKRFSSKEESRRIVAAVYDPTRVGSAPVAFENHLNYYHSQGAGLPPTIAKGLAAFLNSTLVDTYFRQFSGHTQVNAADLRSLRYPERDLLAALGRKIGSSFPAQDELDRQVDAIVSRG